jgi:hypothetical protein
MAPMRQGIAAVGACAALCVAPAGAAAAAGQVPSADAPVVVKGVPITMAQAHERAGSRADADQVDDAIAELVLARWVAGEAARRGVRADPGEIAAGIRRERAAGNRVGAAERARMAETVLRRALVASMTRHAHGQRAWSRAFADLARRWRAVTRCLPGHTAPSGRCANVPVGSDHCAWLAFGDVCHAFSEWFTNIDLVGELNPPGKELDCIPDGDDAVDRVRSYLRRHSPAVAKRVFFDTDCDPQLITAKQRADLEVARCAVARLGAA